MSIPFAKPLAIDARGNPLQEFPTPFVAIKIDASENNLVSSVITLTDDTTVIEVAATGAAAMLRWIPADNTNPSVISAAGTSNADHSIPANAVRRFVVPIETLGITSIVGANKRNGLYNRVAVKSVQIGSILTTQY